MIDMNSLPRIDDIWLVVSVDAEGNEGLCGMQTPVGWSPLVAADPKRLPTIERAASLLANEDIHLRLIRLSQRTVEREWNSPDEPDA